MEKYKIYKHINKHARNDKTYISYVFILQNTIDGITDYWALPDQYNGKWLSTFTKALHRSELRDFKKLKDYSEIQNITKQQLIEAIFEKLKNYI